MPRPSSVVMLRPATPCAGITQDRAATPSTCTVHAPHCPSPQPYLGPLRPRSLRSRCSSVASRGTPASAWARPLAGRCSGSAARLAVRGVHLQVHEGRAVVVLRAVVDGEVAEARAADALEPGDEAVARERLARAAQALGHHARDDVALECGVAVDLLAELGAVALVVSPNPHPPPPATM